MCPSTYLSGTFGLYFWACDYFSNLDGTVVFLARATDPGSPIFIVSGFYGARIRGSLTPNGSLRQLPAEEVADECVSLFGLRQTNIVPECVVEGFEDDQPCIHTAS